MPNRINKGNLHLGTIRVKLYKTNRKDLKKQSKSEDKPPTITSWQIDGETTET